MKYLKWILFCLVVVGLVYPTDADAGRRRRFLLHVIAAKNADEAAPSDLISTITFEDPPYTNGAELDDATGEGWTEVNASTNVFISTNADAHGGSQSMFVDVTTGDGAYLYKSFTSTSTTFTMDVYYAVANDTLSPVFGLCNGDPSDETNNWGPYIRIDSGDTDDLSGHDGTSWVSITSGNPINTGTFYHVEIEVTPSAVSCTYKVWFEGSQQGTTFDCKADLAAFDRVCFVDWALGARDAYYDDLHIYTGTRQAP